MHLDNGFCVGLQKFELETQGHQPMMEKVLANGNALIKARHFASPEIRQKNKDVREAWDQLAVDSAERRRKLDISLQKQQVNLNFSPSCSRPFGLKCA